MWAEAEAKAIERPERVAEDDRWTRSETRAMTTKEVNVRAVGRRVVAGIT